MSSGSVPVLVTGAAGFIGSHLVDALLARGERVVGVDNFDSFYARAIKERNLAGARARGGAFELAEVDIADADGMGAVLARVRPGTIVHLAGLAGVRPSLADPVRYARVNVLGTAAVLDAAHRTGCARVVLASSSSVYGNCPEAPFREDMDVSEPISPYAATKRACELLAWTHHRVTGQPVACLRFFTVFGPRQRPDLAIGRFLRAVGAGEPVTMFGNGGTSRDYTYVDDVVAGILAACARVDTHGYRVWNLGGSSPVRLDALLRAVERTVGRAPVLREGPAQPGDVERTWADLTRARAELGYEVRVPLEEGLRRQWAWMQRGGV